MSDQMIHLAVDLLGADTPEEQQCRSSICTPEADSSASLAVKRANCAFV